MTQQSPPTYIFIKKQILTKIFQTSVLQTLMTNKWENFTLQKCDLTTFLFRCFTVWYMLLLISAKTVLQSVYTAQS